MCCFADTKTPKKAILLKGKPNKKVKGGREGRGKIKMDEREEEENGRTEVEEKKVMEAVEEERGKGMGCEGGR